MARALILLAALTALRLAVAAAAPLSADEAYYWVWSRALQPGYLDHPPMVALWIRAGTALAGQGAFGIRLLSPIAAAVGSVLLARAAEDLFPGRRLGLPAAALLNATLLMAAGAVTMTPDTPLLLFWTAALWALARLVATGRPGWWLAVGVFAGAALASKYTAALLGLGIALWLVARRRAALAAHPLALGRRRAGGGCASRPCCGGTPARLRQLRQAGRPHRRLAPGRRRCATWPSCSPASSAWCTPWVALLCAAGIWLAARRFRQGAAPALLACAQRARRGGVPAARAGRPGAGQLAGQSWSRPPASPLPPTRPASGDPPQRRDSSSAVWSTSRPAPRRCRCRARWIRR